MGTSRRRYLASAADEVRLRLRGHTERDVAVAAFADRQLGMREILAPEVLARYLSSPLAGSARA
jgi:hypothetical protein